MMGAKKYDVLKRFADQKRTDYVFARLEGGNVKNYWEPMDVLILIHLCGMGFINVTVEHDAAGKPVLTFALTDDGRLYMNGAKEELAADYGRGAT